MNVYLSEKFISIQGEGGKNIGKKSVFLRFSGCNLNCLFCDTPQKEKREEENLDDIIAYIYESNTNNIVLTGGEPFLHSNIMELLIGVFNTSHTIEIETNGTLPIPSVFKNSNVYINMSPKIDYYKYTHINLFPISIDPLHIIYKFPVDGKLEAIQKTLEFIDYFNLPKESIYLMPLSKNYQQYIYNSEIIINECIKNNLNFSPRLQYVHMLK